MRDYGLEGFIEMNSEALLGFFGEEFHDLLARFSLGLRGESGSILVCLNVLS